MLLLTLRVQKLAKNIKSRLSSQGLHAQQENRADQKTNSSYTVYKYIFTFNFIYCGSKNKVIAGKVIKMATRTKSVATKKPTAL